MPLGLSVVNYLAIFRFFPAVSRCCVCTCETREAVFAERGRETKRCLTMRARTRRPFCAVAHRKPGGLAEL